MTVLKSLAFAAGLAALVSPAQAFERMLRSDCQAAFERLADMTGMESGANDDQLARMIRSTKVTPDGWCEMRASDPGFEDAEFERFQWRADGITSWTREGVPPLALQVRIRGLEPDEMQGGVSTRRPQVDFEATLRQLPEAGQLIVERAVMANSAGDELSFSGVFERVYLTSESMMQVSIGSAVFKAGLMSMTLDGIHENPFAFNWDVEMQGVPQAQRDAAFDIISKLPDGFVDDASRAELTAYAGDLPKPVGTLEIIVSSERGLGLMQVGMSMYSSFVAVMDDSEATDQMAILLDGVTLSADWTPAAQVAD